MSIKEMKTVMFWLVFIIIYATGIGVSYGYFSQDHYECGSEPILESYEQIPTYRSDLENYKVCHKFMINEPSNDGLASLIWPITLAITLAIDNWDLLI